HVKGGRGADEVLVDADEGKTQAGFELGLTRWEKHG
ncbi:hypothetical protein AVEN_156655-1, partial [Araneus ventricosus]